jgi:hypothetical protein
VIEAYFAGAPPFREVKRREDFPDAFVYAALADLASRSAVPVAFVSADERLADACRRGLPGVSVYKSLDDLIARADLAAALREHVLETQFDKARWMIVSLRAGYRQIVREVALATQGQRVLVLFPIYGAATVTEIRQLGPLVLGRPTYYGGGLLGVPFSTRVACQLNVSAPVSEVNIGRARRYAEVHEQDGQVEADLERTLVVSGSLLMELAPEVLEREVPDEALADAVNAADVVIESSAIFGGEGSKDVDASTLLMHARLEAAEQIDHGDHDVSLDPEEEADRVTRAVPWTVPPDFPDELRRRGSLRIAPLPRFEHLVRIVKKQLLAEASREPEEASQGEAGEDKTTHEADAGRDSPPTL